MKKTISLLTMLMMFSSYCLAYDNKRTDPPGESDVLTEDLLIYTINCNEWIEGLPCDIQPTHYDPADQLDLRLDNIDWTQDNFHFNYLLHPCSDEACYKQASLRFRQQTGHRIGDGSRTPIADMYAWLWYCKTN